MARNSNPHVLTRRQMIGLLGSAGAAVLVGCTSGGGAPTPTIAPSLLVPNPVPRGGRSPRSPRAGKGVVLGASRDYAQRLELATHQYAAWDSDIFDPNDTKTFLLDTTAFLNIKFAPANWEKGQPALWGAIASGSQDARIEEWAGILNRIPRKLSIALHHEPLPDDASGTHEGRPEDLLAATRRVADRWRAAGVKHILTQGLFLAQVRSDVAVTDDMDAIGVDAYADSTRPTADELLGGLLSTARSAGKPIVIYETAFRDASDGDGQQERYYDSLDTLLKQEKSIIGCALWLSFTARHDDRLNSEGLAVVRRMASDPFYARQF